MLDNSSGREFEPCARCHTGIAKVPWKAEQLSYVLVCSKQNPHSTKPENLTVSCNCICSTEHVFKVQCVGLRGMCWQKRNIIVIISDSHLKMRALREGYSTSCHLQPHH